MELISKQTHIDFMGKFKMALMVSALLILAGLASIAVQGGLKYGIDFAGGTLVQLKFQDPPSIDTIRKSLKAITWAIALFRNSAPPMKF